MPKGRPAISGERKWGTVALRVSDSERALLDAAAALASKPTSTWARDELLRLATEATAAKPATKKAPGIAKKPKA